MAAMRMTPRVQIPGRLIAKMAIGYALVLLASCVPASNAYRVVPGLRGPEVTVAIAPMADGMIAPRLTTTPLAPVEFDLADLPALDAVTNPAALVPYDPTLAGLMPGDLGPMPTIPTTPLARFGQTELNAGPSATAFAFRGLTGTDSMRSQLCLTAAVYYEAASESDDGQRAVAQVVLNRVRHPAYPNTVCDVVYQGTERGDRLCQFTFACDGSLARTPARSAWERASRVARLALAGYVMPEVGTATHYHTLAVNPYWNKSLKATAIIGAHIFYRWGNRAGEPGAFYARYTGREPTPGPRPAPYRAPSPMTAPSIGQGLGNGIGMPSVMAGAAVDNSLAAIQAKANDGLLAQQAALARASAAMAPTKPIAQDNRYVSGALPESDIRPEFRKSGEWIKR